MTGVGRRLDEPDNIVRGKDVGGGPGSLFAAKNRRRQLVALILSADMPGESDHVAKAAGALVDGPRQSGPLNGGLSAHMLFALRLGEGGKTS
jgi:hypothetical protein